MRYTGMLVTNCPNCGGPLTSDGFCEYCKTKIRYANTIELESGFLGFDMSEVEILLKCKKDDTTYLYPFVGRLRTIDIALRRDTLYVNHECVVSAAPDVELCFSGTFVDNNYGGALYGNV